jgi:soluble lytic murein transglycosylase
MKLKTALILIAALFFVSTVAGLVLLIYIKTQGVPSAIARVVPAGQATLDDSPTPEPATSTPSPPPPLATATATHTPLPTATPSPTPSRTPTNTPTLTPSPTPVPAARLADAHQAKRNGDYGRARTEFQVVLQEPEAEWEAAEAAYQVGLCAFLDGDAQAASELLTAFIEQYPEDHRVGTAHFYLGEALSSLGDAAAAVEHYQLYLTQQDVLADLVYVRIAKNNVALGDYQAAVQAYEQAIAHTSDLSQEYDLREQLALVYSAWGDYEQAIQGLQSILERSQNVYRLARIWYLIGQTYRSAGREKEALDAFAQAVNGDPRPGYAHAALIALVEAYEPVDEYKRGLIDYYAGSYGAAIAAFQRYMDITPDYDSDAHYYTALAHIQAHSYDLAVQECDSGLAFPDTIPHWGEMWLLKGQALAEQELYDQAVETYIDFADQYPDHPLAPQARWEAAQCMEQQDRFDQAADIYTTLADKHINAAQAPAARFRAGLCRYLDGDHAAAQIAWRELVNGYPTSTESLRGRYWLGKLYKSQGEIDQARVLLHELAEQYPRDYYGLRAAHLLENDGASITWLPAPAHLHLTSDREAEKKEAEAWLHSWADVAEPGDLNTASAALSDDLHFRRAMELLTLGLQSEAVDEFEGLRQEIGQDPLALYQFALWTQDIGLYAPSLRATIDLITLAPEPSVFDMPRLIQHLAFPVHFADLVLSESAEYDIDPLLMFALIRQESVFDDHVISWAGAVGLTQVMPSTGEWIAEMMPWPQYDDALLQRAYLNIKFGAWFLGRLLKDAEGDVMVALAGYNGGPAYARLWQEQAGKDPDLFVEIISRSEPQNYVREIYRHYDAYTRLYGAG